MDFIKLTGCDGLPVYVNVKAIVLFEGRDDAGNYTRIKYNHGNITSAYDLPKWKCQDLFSQ